MQSPKPMRYNLEICFGSFDGDSAGFESSTPFVPLHVGDYIDHRLSNMEPGGEELPNDKVFRVTAIKHSFQDLQSHISQYVRACVEAAPKP